jgi:hypothetical protein
MSLFGMGGSLTQILKSMASLTSGGGKNEYRRNNKPNIRANLTVTELEDRCVPAVVNLTTSGAVGFANNAVFQQVSPHPAGSGVFRPFLRLQADAIEQGINTDGPLLMNELTSRQFTHALQLSDVPESTIGGAKYREFVLDLNQSGTQPLISLDELRLFVAKTGNLDYNAATQQLTGGQAAVYDLGNNWVELNAGLHPGLGTADAVVYVPSALFGSDPATYVYLYSKFGVNYGANGGFEQWTEATTPAAAASIPAPAVSLSNISGYVYSPSASGLAGVTITLSGADIYGSTVTKTTTTDQNGYYQFQGLLPGSYTLASSAVTGYSAGLASAGTVNGATDGTAGLGLISAISLGWGNTGVNFDFFEVANAPAPSSTILVMA